MANRYFENEEHTKLYQRYRVQPPQSLIDTVIAYLKEKYSGELNIAYDVGCGSGQNTLYYADHFKKVIGSDVSPNQIASATANNTKENVTFEVSPAEAIKAQDGSVQLITAMTAAHWFDLPKFWIEGERVLSPAGVMALYCYIDSTISWERNIEKNDTLNEIYSKVARDSALSDLWAPQVQFAVNKYRDVTIPYDDLVRDEDTFYQERQVSLSHLLGAIKTWSAFEKLKEVSGAEAAEKLLQTFQQSILDVIKDDLNENETSPDDILFLKRTPFFLLMARKSTAE